MAGCCQQQRNSFHPNTLSPLVTPLANRDLLPCDSSQSLALPSVRGLPLPSQSHLSHSKHSYITTMFFLAIWSWSGVCPTPHPDPQACHLLFCELSPVAPMSKGICPCPRPWVAKRLPTDVAFHMEPRKKKVALHTGIWVTLKTSLCHQEEACGKSPSVASYCK